MLRKFHLIGALAMAALLMNTAHAQTKTPKTTAAKTTRHQVLSDLRQAHALLAGADHDYQGHRAAAATQIHQAVQALKPHNPTTPPPAPSGAGKAGNPPTTGKKGIREPQAVSDAQLRSALDLLNAAEKLLPSLGNGAPVATKHVKAAVKELTTALTIR